jgi:hypothetical protein
MGCPSPLVSGGSVFQVRETLGRDGARLGPPLHYLSV